jgi:hypothetical protein
MLKFYAMVVLKVSEFHKIASFSRSRQLITVYEMSSLNAHFMCGAELDMNSQICVLPYTDTVTDL